MAHIRDNRTKNIDVCSMYSRGAGLRAPTDPGLDCSVVYNTRGQCKSASAVMGVRLQSGARARGPAYG